ADRAAGPRPPPRLHPGPDPEGDVRPRRLLSGRRDVTGADDHPEGAADRRHGRRPAGRPRRDQADRFVPRQQTGLHLHTCPVVGYVARAPVLFQIEGEPPRTLKEGDAFHEPAGARILHFDNASDRDPLTFIAFYLLGPDDRELITMLD